MAATHAQPSAKPARRFIDPILGRALEERDLPAARRRPEAAAVELGRVAARAMPVQPEAPAGDVEALLDEIGVGAGAGDAGAEVWSGVFAGAGQAVPEVGVVVAPAADLAHDADDVLRALGVVGGEPFLEQDF